VVKEDQVLRYEGLPSGGKSSLHGVSSFHFAGTFPAGTVPGLNFRSNARALRVPSEIISAIEGQIQPRRPERETNPPSLLGDRGDSQRPDARLSSGALPPLSLDPLLSFAPQSRRPENTAWGSSFFVPFMDEFLRLGQAPLRGWGVKSVLTSRYAVLIEYR
jgi:hypothetical protein